MKNKYVYLDLEKEFLKHEEYQSTEGTLLKSVIVSKIKELDEKTISIILSFPELKDKFTKPFKDILLLDQQSLLSFFQSREFINNSFTEYTNKIGLANGLKFLDNSDEVVLDFPYKDCVLLGNQSKEENEGVRQKFFHEVINFQEIDRLFTKKVLCNFKKHTKEGVVEVSEFKDTDNLIIKGNNLIALHTIKEKFKEKVKLIYIDPPYNTESLKFAYNDKFDQATWLIFMKNRLEAVKPLLKDDGVICVHIDNKQLFYLKIMMDEIFGVNNFVSMINVRMSNESGPKMSHVKTTIPKMTEYILVYKINLINIEPVRVEKTNWDKEYNLFLNNFLIEDKCDLDKYIENNDIEKIEDILSKITVIPLAEYFKKNKTENEDIFKINNSYRIIATKPNSALLKIAKKQLDSTKQRNLKALRNPSGHIKIIITDFNQETDTARIEVNFAIDNQQITLGDWWEDIVTTGGVAQEGSVVLKNGKKPEALLKRIVSMFTKEKDIVLDYHLGSGTTCAVAHKMGRQYIGIEQLDYIENDSIKRIENVINNDSSGISKSLNWQGGGEFISMRLYSIVEEVLNKIAQAQSQIDIDSIVNLLLSEKYFYYLGINENKTPYDEIFTSPEFKQLSIVEQQKLLHAAIDKNNLYVDFNDINDDVVNISKTDKELNINFYKDNK